MLLNMAKAWEGLAASRIFDVSQRDRMKGIAASLRTSFWIRQKESPANAGLRSQYCG
jgi:hypothetical protein